MSVLFAIPTLISISEITVAWAKLLGVFTRQNIPEAARTFQKYANEGIPDAQMGLGFLYATGAILLLYFLILVSEVL